jgi:hypothetical protein
VTRISLLVLVLAVPALLTATPVTAFQTMETETHSAPVDIRLELDADHGLHATIENFEKITLEVERKGRLVTYEAPGEVTETGLKVQFGKLGVIDVAFKPIETRLDRPPKGCAGKPSTSSEGFFVGTIDFTGEREYVRIGGDQAKGTLSVWRESEWRCPKRRGKIQASREGPRRPAAGFRRRAEAKEEPATLSAFGARCRCFFAAYAERDRKGRGPSTFVGAKFEKREGMEISRVTYAKAGSLAFVFDHAAGTATVHPPAPFSGSGAFKRRLHSRDLWRGAIQVPLLGADPLSFNGPGVRARLVRALPGGD